MSIEQQSADVAVRLISQTLKPSQNEILLATLVKVFSTRHPGEFLRVYQETVAKLSELNRSKPVVKLVPESDEDYSNHIIYARGKAWEITEALWQVGAGLAHPSQLFEIMRVESRLTQIGDEDLATIVEQTFHGFMNSKGVIQND